MNPENELIFMQNILFVCKGNMVRSQIAEALYKKYKDGDVMSAGILPNAEQRSGILLKDLDIDAWIRALNDKEGIDVSLNICKQVTKEMVDKAKKIVVMAKKEICPDFLKNRKDVIWWRDVKDNGDISQIIDQIKTLVMAL